MEYVDIFYIHLMYFTATLHILWPFDIFYGYFSPFWYVVPRKIWQPCFESGLCAINGLSVSFEKQVWLGCVMEISSC
jgi:hypothetical protein